MTPVPHTSRTISWSAVATVLILLPYVITGGFALSMLMQMGTGFGGDVTVGEGMATFEIGTKLEDGKKRQFSIMFHNM